MARIRAAVLLLLAASALHAAPPEGQEEWTDQDIKDRAYYSNEIFNALDHSGKGYLDFHTAYNFILSTITFPPRNEKDPRTNQLWQNIDDEFYYGDGNNNGVCDLDDFTGILSNILYHKFKDMEPSFEKKVEMGQKIIFMGEIQREFSLPKRNTLLLRQIKDFLFPDKIDHPFRNKYGKVNIKWFTFNYLKLIARSNNLAGSLFFNLDASQNAPGATLTVQQAVDAISFSFPKANYDVLGYIVPTYADNGNLNKGAFLKLLQESVEPHMTEDKLMDWQRANLFWHAVVYYNNQKRLRRQRILTGEIPKQVVVREILKFSASEEPKIQQAIDNVLRQYHHPTLYTMSDAQNLFDSLKPAMEGKSQGKRSYDQLKIQTREKLLNLLTEALARDEDEI